MPHSERNWEIAHAAVSRSLPISLSRTVRRATRTTRTFENCPPFKGHFRSVRGRFATCASLYRRTWIGRPLAAPECSPPDSAFSCGTGSTMRLFPVEHTRGEGPDNKSENDGLKLHWCCCLV
jgi:hypothetical protein